jgi:hypothetical protein
MDSKIFIKRIKDILPYVFTYASDFYGLKSDQDIKKILDSKKTNEFVNKCHEGFKIAQREIIKNILEIEREMVVVNNKINEIKKDKFFNKLKNDVPYINLISNLEVIKFQKKVFQEVANCIVWTVYRGERTEIKALMQPDMHHKSLLEGNIKSLLNTADYYNRDINKFALITDITSCIGLGDLLVIDTKKSMRTIVEVKEGKINNLIIDIIKSHDTKVISQQFKKINEPKERKNFAKQLKRVLEQELKMINAIDYTIKGTGVDLFTGKNKAVIEIAGSQASFSNLINEGFKYLRSQKKEDEVYFPFDCGIVCITKGIGLAKRWDFQHFILHRILSPDKICAYTTQDKMTLESFREPSVSKHFKDIQNVPIYNIRDKFNNFTHQPLFFTLNPNDVLDIISNNIAIYIYLDLKEFYKLMKMARLFPLWKDYSKTVSKEGGFLSKQIVKFGDKCLYFGTRKNRMPLMYGILFRIIYEFTTTKSVINQLINLVKEINKKSEGPTI